MSTELSNLQEKLNKNEITVGILGIGRVGLPLGLSFAHAGLKVLGLDVNKDYVESLKRGEIPFIEKGIENYINNKNFFPTIDAKECMEQSDILLVTVATPIKEGGHPDYSQILSVLNDLKNADLRGKLLIMRSTSSPGTLENIVKPFLEKETGLAAGKDFGLAVCPERIIAGKALEELVDLPEIVGALDPLSKQITADLFRKINPNKKISFTTPKAASTVSAVPSRTGGYFSNASIAIARRQRRALNSSEGHIPSARYFSWTWMASHVSCKMDFASSTSWRHCALPLPSRSQAACCSV